MRRLFLLLVATLVVLVLSGCSGQPGASTPEGGSEPSTAAGGPREIGPGVTLEPRAPLAGHTVVIDPGHQLGNSRHVSEINTPVDAGGFMKACNTTGTATNAGLPEATFTWEVAVALRKSLERLGAAVVLTRSSNSSEKWGPCVDERGRMANQGDLMVSLHGDGNLSAGARGFHVIANPDLDGSHELAQAVRNGLDAAGLQRSTYLGVEGLDSRTDLGTLNLAERPAVMVELGNMRHPDDAALMASADGRASYVDGLARGIRRFLTR